MKFEEEFFTSLKGKWLIKSLKENIGFKRKFNIDFFRKTSKGLWYLTIIWYIISMSDKE